MLGTVLMSIVSTCTIISYLPQLIKLLRTKNARDLSPYSWLLWVISFFFYTLYAVLVAKDILIILQALLELSFCVTILILIIIYQRRARS